MKWNPRVNFRIFHASFQWGADDHRQRRHGRVKGLVQDVARQQKQRDSEWRTKQRNRELQKGIIIWISA